MSWRSRKQHKRKSRLSGRAKLYLYGIPILILLVAWWSRTLIVRLMPIEHEGVVMRIDTFDKGWRGDRTRQNRQFAIAFEDGFNCECYDTSFANVRIGDRIKIRAYHDVKGWPLWDPEWWECDEGQLIKIYPPEKPGARQ